MYSQTVCVYMMSVGRSVPLETDRLISSVTGRGKYARTRKFPVQIFQCDLVNTLRRNLGIRSDVQHNKRMYKVGQKL